MRCPVCGCTLISIHALLAESDTSQPHCAGSFAISIHALLAESDPIISSATSCRWLFLSTLSLRRATAHRRHLQPGDRHFYPRSPCGERHIKPTSVLTLVQFLSTLSLRRATSCRSSCIRFIIHFYPRSPCGERRQQVPVHQRGGSISIHALLAESDASICRAVSHFLISIHALLAESDSWMVVSAQRGYISIHALLAESDLTLRVSACLEHYFYPRSPCGERLLCHFLRFCSPISIHALLAESDHHHRRRAYLHCAFLSTLSLRRATACAPATAAPRLLFLSTLSLRRATQQ